MLAQISQPPVCGWVLDLRTNHGGNMWPMLAAVGPMLGNGKLGTFIDKTGNQSAWFYRAGAVGAGNVILFQSTPPNLGTDYTASPVAVLTGGSTASSGEAVVIAFSGRQHSERFGSLTAGYTTITVADSLSDGALLILTVGREADRTGHVFDGRISPDFYVANGSSSDDVDDVLSSATAWLNVQCSF